MNEINGFFNKMIGVVHSFRVNDFFDIIVVSFIIFKVIQIIKETRAVQLFKGIALFAMVSIVAKILNLKTLDYIIHCLFLWGPLVLVIIFQREIRHFLEIVGRAKMRDKLHSIFFFEQRNADVLLERVIGKFSKVCEELAKEKIGALIVFERETKLADIAATGVIINADVSEELVKNIFFKNSPLHDGAIIVRDLKIIAASCFLPKPSKEEYISRVLGSRHRAAIGMSENSDSIVIVVSEETGSISIAQKGNLKQNLNKTQLHECLHDCLIKPETSNK